MRSEQGDIAYIYDKNEMPDINILESYIKNGQWKFIQRNLQVVSVICNFVSIVVSLIMLY